MSDIFVKDLIYSYNYYEKQLLIKSFSYWIIWFQTEKNAAIVSQNKAYTFLCTVRMKKVFKCLNKLINKSSHEMYCNQLAISMNELLLLQKGLQFFKNYVHNSDHRINSNNSIFYRDTNHCRRLFNRLYYQASSKLIYRRKLFIRFRDVIRDTLDHWVTFTISRYNKHAKVLKIKNIYVKSLIKSCIKKLHQNVLKYKFFTQAYIKAFNCATVKRFSIAFYKLKFSRKNRKTHYFKLQNCNLYYLQQCQKRYFHTLYKYIIQCWQRRKYYRIKWDIYFKYTSLRRAMFLLLKHLKYKLYKRQQISECKLFLHQMMIWKFRRQSDAIVTWQCLFQRNKIDLRRLNIATFHFRQRFLNCYWKAYLKYLHVSKLMKCNCRKGEFFNYLKKASYCMLKIKQHRIKSRNQMILCLKGILFWKLWRSVLVFKCFRSYCNVRKYKRSSLLKANAAYYLQEKKNACAEFIKVALCNNSNNNCLRRNFENWKSLMPKRKLLKNQNMLLDKTDFNNNYYFENKNICFNKNIIINPSSDIASTISNDFHYSLLSREKPRCLSSILAFHNKYDNSNHLLNSNVVINSEEGIINNQRECSSDDRNKNNNFINNQYIPTVFAARESPRLPIKNNYQITFDGKINSEGKDMISKSPFITTTPITLNDKNILQSTCIIEILPQPKQMIVQDILNFIEEFKHLLINN